MTNFKIAAAAAVIALFATPTFAGDHDSAAELVSSGRFMPGYAVGSAIKGAPAVSTTNPDDFQLGGR